MNLEENEVEKSLDAEAEKLCQWAAARAGAIVIIPMVGTIALVANEFYMIERMSKLYGYDLNEKSISAFIGGLGGAFAGQTLATLIPFPPMQVPIGVAVTYAVGKAAQAWLRNGMKDSAENYKDLFKAEKENAKKMLVKLKDNAMKGMPLGDESKKFKF